MPAQTFKLPGPNKWEAVVVLALLTIVVSLAGGLYLPWRTSLDFWAAALISGLSIGAIPTFLALRGALRDARNPAARAVLVGTDGVVVKGRLVHHADIRAVSHEWREREVRYEDRSADSPPADSPPADWVVSIQVGGVRGGGRLFGGETLEIVTRADAREGSEDPLGARLRRALEESLSEWRAGQRGGGLPADLTRRERSGAEWLQALRAHGTGTSTSSYRSAAVDLDRLSRALEDPRTKPSVRAAAAVVLSAAGDATAKRKLRIAAESIVDPRTRIALEHVAEDAAAAEALEELDAADGEQGERRAHREEG